MAFRPAEEVIPEGQGLFVSSDPPNICCLQALLLSYVPNYIDHHSF